LSNTEILIQSLNIIQSKIKGSEVENTSSYHNLSNWRFPHEIWRTARNVKNLLIALSFIGLPDFQQNEFRTKAHKIAEKYSFQGEWASVEELLQLNNIAPGQIIAWYLKTHSPEDWFGDTLRRCIKIMKSARTYNPYLPSKHKVRIPERKRGYDDKGSLPRYDKLGKEYYAVPDKEKTVLPDLNNTPFYPTWYNQENENLQGEKIGKSHFPDHKEVTTICQEKKI